MAFIYKKPGKKGKGVIILSHKEFFLFHHHANLRNIKEKLKYYFLTKYVALIKQKLYGKYLDLLKEKYLIGVHWGWHFEDLSKNVYVDFHLASKGTLTLQQSNKTPILNFASVNFLPDCYDARFPKTREFDVISIARDVEFKGLDIFIRAVSPLLNSGKIKNVCLIVPEGLDQAGKKESLNLRILIDCLVDRSKLNSFHYIRISGSGGFLGVNREFTSFLLRKAKVFCLFSKKEGVAKVINEAQLCGCNVVTYKNLVGGGLDFVDEKFFFPFAHKNEAPNAIINALNSPLRSYDSLADLRKRLLQKHTIKDLDQELDRIFGRVLSDHPSNPDDRNLSKAFPNHDSQNAVPWMDYFRQKFYTSDLKDINDMKNFVDYVSSI